MKKYVFILTFLFLTISLFSCTKQTVNPQSQSDEVTVELQRVIAANNIKRIIAWDDRSGFPTNISTTLGTSWSFSNGFITISGYGGSPDSYSRNLLYLDNYEIGNVLLGNGTNPIALVLHFKN
ncbi:MAG: hypothetical protein K2Q21_04115 [Chitinophagaceae bacterium]|nr:hypothetical protein [Chitinophagaceae bacterium]